MTILSDGEKKFLNSDTRLLVIFVIFAVLTVGYVLSQILGLDNPGSLSTLLAGIACVTLSSLILGAVEVVRHLRRNTHDIYKADLALRSVSTSKPRPAFKTMVVTAFDISFILILCFVILLMTMLVTKGLRSGAVHGYTVDPLMLCAVVAALALYQYFMTHASTSELRQMFKDNFTEAELPKEDKQ